MKCIRSNNCNCACFKQGVSWHSCNYECRFTLKRVSDMITTLSQMHRSGKYSQHSLIIWLVWLNGWVFVYVLRGCGSEPRCSH